MYPRDTPPESIVYCSSISGRPVIGVFDMDASVPGGALHVNLLTYVEEGQVLQVR